MTRQLERTARSEEAPIVGGLPDAYGIVVAMRLAPHLAVHLHGVANALLVDPLPGSTLTRGERELIATAASAANDCFYCMDAHGAFAVELLGREGRAVDRDALEAIKEGGCGELGDKLAALLAISRRVSEGARGLTRAHVESAIQAGATDGDVQLAVFIAAAFAMYNRLVDGLRARTPADVADYAPRAVEIADGGYGPARPLPAPIVAGAPAA